SMAEEMNDCAIEFSPDIDEIIEVGLTKESSNTVNVPRIKESLVHLECELEKVLHFGDKPGAGSLVIGKVVHVHVNDALYDKGRIDSTKLKPIGRMAGNMFTDPLAKIFEMERKT
ncbi:MAG: flavin reductase family protein, partial [Bacillus sp. (in: firmicutes)]